MIALETDVAKILRLRNRRCRRCRQGYLSVRLRSLAEIVHDIARDCNCGRLQSCS